ncbi:hypothetical protein KFL_001600130 [Klebsormidium nitens]|uniref:Thioredoxin domain-containing protein n=1 Tax=Klebsormidium nitens TaxID=105231 RepID=A0A1Y1HZY2_KLENI|nr:hypothetical protein KFL_001600130 [Klebsormidium nitens]|eukprot:GAQ83743.1 hypothetical protein KFL_001600130 [Klebsormidium nitens]
MAITASHATVRLPSSFSCSSSLQDAAPTSSFALQHTSRITSASKPRGLLSIASAPIHAGLFAKTAYLGRQLAVVRATQLRVSGGHRGRGGALVTRNAGTVEKVTAKELDDILLNERTKPIVIDFYATWCGPCIMLAQELKQLSAELGDKVRFLKVDTDEETMLASQLRIQGLPTMVFVSDDKTKNAIRTEGLLSSEQIKEIIEKEL